MAKTKKCLVCGVTLEHAVHLLGKRDFIFCSAFCAVTLQEWTAMTEKISLFAFYMRRKNKRKQNGKEVK